MRRGLAIERYRLAGCLRALSALFLLILALAVFWQPLAQVAGPGIAPVVRQIPLLRPKPAPGFMVRVVSEPLGATVVIDGTERGSTPLFGNVACEAGQPVTIAVHKEDHPTWRRTVPCRVGKELTVRARLGAANPPAR